MKKRSLFIVALALMFGFGLVAGQAFAKDMTAKDFVGEAKKTITEISVVDAKKAFDKGGYTFVDCRTAKEYKMGHIPGAIHISRGVLEFKAGKMLPDKNANIIVNCKSGGRSALGTCTLCEMGYKNVKSLAGGWKAWVKAGYPIE